MHHKITILGIFCHNSDEVGFFFTELSKMSMVLNNFIVFLNKKFKFGKNGTAIWENCIKLRYFTDWEMGPIIGPKSGLD